MPREGAINIEGVVVEALNDRLYRVELANGHRLLGHLPRGRKTQHAIRNTFSVGATVTLEMSCFDFSKGRILLSKT